MSRHAGPIIRAAVAAADNAITNAKLADMAVDTVKGRVTAGTGDPEDVATTGSGNVVRATSPTLVTPALGTPASGVMTNVTGLPTAGLVDSAVTYAKIQNVSATDRVLGRSTVGAGVVEEITTTGSGSVVRATSPTLVTPALGTPASGVLTNVTGLPTAGLVDAAVTYAKIQNVSATDKVLGRSTVGAGVVEEIATTGSGNVVRATSPTLVTPALGTPVSGVLTNATGLPTAGLVDSAVTYAKIQNVSATDRVLGRSTVGAGVVEEIATTGSGSVVRATSPTLVTPALGTPASGVLTNVTGLPTAGLVDSAVTYAKIQNVSATDKVLGRTTVGAGVVEEIATTGSGSVVRATSPTLVTPALGTPASGVLTNATGLPTAGLVDAAVTLAKMADIATARFIGRTTAATGVPEALTATQATALLDAATATVKGLVPAPPNNTTTFLRGDATFAAPAAGAGALTRVGGNTTEATTTSLTEVSLVTISTLSIGALVPILALGIWNKTAGAAASVSVGLMLNATAGYMSAISDAVDAARNGAFEFYAGSRQTNYARPGWRLRNMAGTSDLAGTADDVPLVTITDVIIRGLTGSVSVTLAVDEIHVYTYAVS